MINVYEGIKGIKKVKSLQNQEDIQNATNLGILPSGVTMLFSKSHVELSVALEGKRHQTDDVVWLGFHFSGSFQKFQKIFSKSLPNPTFENISALLHKSLVCKFEDPYSSPLYITGVNDSKAFWTVSLPENPSMIYCHIPLHRSDSFHSLQSYPILHLESDMQVVIGTDLDRNQLFPTYPNIDTLYTQTLRNIDPILSPYKWSSTVIPTIKNNNNSNTNENNNSSSSNQENHLTKNQFDLEKLSKWFLKKFYNPTNSLTFVYGVSFYKKGANKSIDMVTLKSLGTGKTYIVNLVHTFKLTPPLDFFKDTEVTKKFENDHLPQYIANFAELEKDCQGIKNLVPSTSVSIYNPFFDKYLRKKIKLPPPQIVESNELLQHQQQPHTPKLATTPTPVSVNTIDNNELNSSNNNRSRSSSQTLLSSPPLSSINSIDTNILATILAKAVLQHQQQQQQQQIAN